MHMPAPAPVRDHPQVPEVDLQLLSRLAVVDRDRDLRPARGITAFLGREPGQGPVGHVGARPLEKLADLHQRQVVLDPALDLLFPLGQLFPRLAVAGRACRADRRDHQPDQVVGQLAFPAVTGQAGLLRGPDIAGRRLHVHPRAGRGRALALPVQPRTQDFYHLCHQDLPECHPCHLSQNGRNRAS